jgi:hypothetical protein
MVGIKKEPASTADETNPKCNCVFLYRQSIELRQILFRTYLSQGSFSYAQCIGFITIIETSVGQAKERMPELMGNDLSAMWNALKPKMASRPPGDAKLVLMLDVALLSGCPHIYQHLLEDALYLRLDKIKRQYKTNLERQLELAKAVKWAETTSKRVWDLVYGKKPPSPKQNWWLRPARGQTPLRFRPIKGESSVADEDDWSDVTAWVRKSGQLFRHPNQ